tara:strand:+ start:728 stop:1003 length:276 start_codon:yes stop_codon:yes gene_type:complete
MNSVDIIDLVKNLGPVFVICLCAFWYIKYQSDRMAKMQDEFNAKDTDHDNKLFEMNSRSIEAMNKISVSLDAYVKSNEQFLTVFSSKGYKP